MQKNSKKDINLHNFDEILDKDEKIIKIIKPSFLRYVTLNVLYVFSFITIISCVLWGTLFAFYHEGNWLTALIVIVCFTIFIILLHTFTVLLEYKKLCYCLTNKRIIIKRGIIGTDFSSIDLEYVGGMNVDVNLLDKLSVKTKTGSIKIMSQATLNFQSSNLNFVLFAVKEPYKVCKEIKETVDLVKQNKLNIKQD